MAKKSSFLFGPYKLRVCLLNQINMKLVDVQLTQERRFLFVVEINGFRIEYYKRRLNKKSISLICSEKRCPHTLQLSLDKIRILDGKIVVNSLDEIKNLCSVKHVCRLRPCRHRHTCSASEQIAADHFTHNVVLYKRVNRKLKEVKDIKHRPDYVEVFVDQESLEKFFRIDVDPEKWQVVENERHDGVPYSLEVIDKNVIQLTLYSSGYFYRTEKLQLSSIWNVNVIPNPQAETVDNDETEKSQLLFEPYDDQEPDTEDKSDTEKPKDDMSSTFHPSCITTILSQMTQLPSVSDSGNADFFSQVKTEPLSNSLSRLKLNSNK